MKKSKLGRLPVLAASCGDAERIRMQPDLKWLMKAETQNVCGESFLVVNFFAREDLDKGYLSPCYRTFFNHDGYITQVIGEDGSRWKTGRREYVMYEGYNGFTEAAGENDCRMICNFFKDWKNGQYSSDPVRLIDGFQSELLQKRLEARHKKIKDRIDREMQGFAEMPPEFEAWIDESVMEHSRYFFYQYEKKATEEGICSCCGKKSRINSREIRYRKQVVCPNCGKTLTALSLGKMPERIHDRTTAAAVQKVDGQLAVRYFHIHKRYRKSEPGRGVTEIFEFVRQIYRAGTWKEYEWDFFKSSGEIRWCDSRERMDTGRAVLWPQRISEILTDTPYAYTALEEYALQRADHTFDVWRYLFQARKYPWIEKLVKCGFWKLADDSTGYYSRLCVNRLIDGEKGKLYKTLKLSRGYFSILPKDVDPYELRFYQECFKQGIKAEPEFFAMCRKHGIHHVEIFDYSEYAPVMKIVRYLAGQMNLLGEVDSLHSAADNLVRSWQDYLGWCKELGYDLHDEYYLLPGRLQQAHDRTYKEYRDYLDRKKKREQKIAMSRATKRLKQVGEKVGKIEKGGYQIIVPKSSKEIVEEGKRLHHCVRSYIPQVADKSTLILFLRKKESPDKPFRTLEWKNNKFKQCQGKSNNEKNGKEILDFLGFAQKKLAERLDEEKAA